ncbi:hypothetical protein F4805DRAFT_458999 [Annulohypoxylon moriforme]|nr:hypothetical protein F4805DRAFT_458999 [Annulohypoxylon moriforme]
MANYIELELKTFDLSRGDSNSSLSVTSLALISGLPPSRRPEEIYQLIQSKQLWLISPGVCRIQISVCRDQSPMGSIENDVGFLEHLADAICQCSLWATLGLTIKQEDIQYLPLYDGAPNLYFIVEHPSKSSVLLSPPHTPTARFNGIECLFRYQSVLSEVPRAVSERYDIRGTDMDTYSPDNTLHPEELSHPNTSYEDAMLSNYWSDLMVNTPTSRTPQRWDDVAYFAQMALHVIIGIKKRTRGLRLFELDDRPSLLELAPAIWNARYLKAVTSHVANFPIISNILATSTRSQSSSLRQKSAKLLIDGIHSGQSEDSKEPEGGLAVYRNSIQQRLWGLLQTTLKPTTRGKNPDSNFKSWSGEFANEAFEFMPMEMDGPGEFEVGPVDMSSPTSSDNISFDESPDSGRSLHKYTRFQVEDASSNFHTIHTAEEETQHEELQHQLLHIDHLYSSLSRYPSSSREFFDIPPTYQYCSDEFTEPISDVDDLHTSDYLYNAAAIHSTPNEF